MSTPRDCDHTRKLRQLSRAFAVCATASFFTSLPAHAELFIDVGAQVTRMKSKIANVDATIRETDSGLHLGVGARRAIGTRSDLGVRLEIDDIGSHRLISVRALDYRRNMSDRLAWTGFFGVSRLDIGTAAYGWYMGGGIQVKGVMPSWDLGIDLRYGDRLARDNVLPTDPQGGSPDNFHALTGISVYLSYRF